MDFFLELHSGLRWIVALSLIAATSLALGGWIQQRWSKLHGIALGSVPVLLTLQFLLGLVLLVRSGIGAAWGVAALRIQLEHALTMLIAVGISHMLPRLARTPDIKTRARKVVLVLLAITVLVFAGVVRIRGIGYWLPF